MRFFPFPAAIAGSRLLACALLAASPVCAQNPAREAADACAGKNGAGAALPERAELASWFALAREVERGLAAGDARFALELKTGGDGSSVYAKVRDRGEVIGAFLSENSSTDVEGEIVSFNLARALGCEELSQRAVAATLRGAGLAAYRQMVRGAVFSGEKEENRLRVLRDIEASPEGLPGVLKQWLPIKPLEYRHIEKPDEPPNGVLNEADPVARYLRADAPQPPAAELALPGLDGARGPARELARELSDILLVDALAGQWDRFSGGNVHVLMENGVAHLAALDNGGATPANDHGYLPLFEKWVTRFDRKTAGRLAALAAFVDAPDAHPFLGFRAARPFAAALGIRSQAGWEAVAGRIREAAAHVRRCEKQGAAFFPEPESGGK